MEEFKDEGKIKSIIKQGEGLNREFKECKNKLSKEVFETVCAFLNRFGGELILGVNDKGRITGINKEKIAQIKKDFATAINNPQVITPTFYLTLKEVTIKEKVILYAYVPESSQVHKYKGRIIDRNEDGDFDITDSENKVYPYVALKDLRSDLIEKTRKMARIQNPGHP